MFRSAAPGPYDEAIGRATDENATSEDWAAILEVCDRVSADAVNGPKEAVQSLIKRLAHRNANVQLYTLELANALSQNCGVPLHRELASRAFTDALLKLANDRNTHNLVRLKILERMKEWSDMFHSNTDLGIMQDAYSRLQHTQPQLQLAPSAPQKNSLTEQDRQREEEDLQRALKLSLEDEADKKLAAPGGGGGRTGSANSPGPSAAGAASSTSPAGDAAAAAAAAPTQGTTAATVSRVRALFDFVASEPEELDFKKGDVIAVLESVYRDWWRGSLKGRTGIFPLNYVEILPDPTPDELQREAQMEAEVFAEIKNVEKLLTLLSASNTAPREEDTDEISKLYHQTLAIRPKLIKLIEKYSQKKDDFTQLNEKFIKARRDYEALLESSMAHPPQPTYPPYSMHQMPPQGYQVGPGGPGGPGGYQAPGMGQQPDQRYYASGPSRQEQPQYPQSPSPNMHRPSNTAPAPFYLANAQAEAQQQPLPQQSPPPQQQQQPPPQPISYPPPQNQQQPGQRLPSGGGPGGRTTQPSPLQTNIPPASAGSTTYLPYNPHQQQAPSVAPSGAPHSTYGNPQELSTSAYDSPIAAHNPMPQQQQQQLPSSANTYSSSVYSPDQFTPPSVMEPSAPAPKPYQAYAGYPAPNMPNISNMSIAALPTASPPPLGGAVGGPPPHNPSAMGPGGGGGSAPSAPPEQPQYRPYVPPSEQQQQQQQQQQGSAPSVDDYYRQTGRVGY